MTYRGGAILVGAFVLEILGSSAAPAQSDFRNYHCADGTQFIAAFFNGEGKCNSCHNPNTDFKGIGGRYDPYVVQGRFMNPRGGRTPKNSSCASIRNTRLG